MAPRPGRQQPPATARAQPPAAAAVSPRSGAKVTVQVQDRQLVLSNLHKPLYDTDLDDLVHVEPVTSKEGWRRFVAGSPAAASPTDNHPEFGG